MKKTTLGQELIQGLVEVLAHEQGQITLRTKEYDVPDAPPVYSEEQLINVRKRLRMSQAVLASVLGVSRITVQSWEQGVKRPSATARRLLQLLIAKPSLIKTVIASR